MKVGKGMTVGVIMTSNFNELSDAETERLSVLIDELSETQQAVAKILRHGYNSYHPDRPMDTNRNDLMEELGHISWVVNLMIKSGDLLQHQIENSQQRRDERVNKYLHHQE